jgi:cytoskeletal protein RodZ
MTVQARGNSGSQSDASPEETETFGLYLARQRELRGISLAQIAEQTRIGIGSLRALEEDDRARLSARVFVVGHIRAYALAIGLNPDEAVLRFDEGQQRLTPAEEEGPRRRPRRRLAAALLAAALALGAAAWLFTR